VLIPLVLVLFVVGSGGLHWCVVFCLAAGVVGLPRLGLAVLRSTGLIPLGVLVSGDPLGWFGLGWWLWCWVSIPWLVLGLGCSLGAVGWRFLWGWGVLLWALLVGVFWSVLLGSPCCLFLSVV